MQSQQCTITAVHVSCNRDPLLEFRNLRLSSSGGKKNRCLTKVAAQIPPTPVEVVVAEVVAEVAEVVRAVGVGTGVGRTRTIVADSIYTVRGYE